MISKQTKENCWINRLENSDKPTVILRIFAYFQPLKKINLFNYKGKKPALRNLDKYSSSSIKWSKITMNQSCKCFKNAFQIMGVKLMGWSMTYQRYKHLKLLKLQEMLATIMAKEFICFYNILLNLVEICKHKVRMWKL